MSEDEPVHPPSKGATRTAPTSPTASSDAPLQEDNATPSAPAEGTWSGAHSVAAHPSDELDDPGSLRRLPALQVRARERYEFIAEHGRGGLGRVYRAHDTELDRDVALKELLRPSHSAEARFVREVLVTARLEHPGVVPIHEAGRWPNGVPFYAMKLVSGRPLSALLSQAETLDQRLALLPHLIAVADAMAYAHDRKVIHRDLKPSNIIVGDYGETVVIDWGLAKELTDTSEDDLESGPYRASATSDVTVAGAVVGTPAYMSPEQSRGERVDPRTDVYALGAILFKLCSGFIPSPQSTQPNLRRHLRGTPPDLAAIALKAMRELPSERYPDAAAFATDLRAYDAGVRVAARNYSLGAMLRLWIRRHKRVAVAVAIPSFVGLTIASMLLRATILRGEREAAAKSEAVRSAHKAQDRSNELLLHQAEVLLTVDPTRAFSLAQSYPRDGIKRQRADAVMADALNRGVASSTIDNIDIGFARGLLWTADDTLAAYGTTSHLFFLRRDGLERPTSIPIARFSNVSMTNSRTALAFQRSDGSIVVRRLQPLADTVLGTVDRAVWDLQMSPTGSHVATSSSDGIIRVWGPHRTAASHFARTPGVYQALRFSPAGNELASCERDGTLTIWNTITNKPILRSKCDGIANIDFQFCGDHLLAGTRAGTIRGHPVSSNGQSAAWHAEFDGPVSFITTISRTDALVASATGHLTRLRCDTGGVIWRKHLRSNITQLSYDTRFEHALAAHNDGVVSLVDFDGRVRSIIRGDARPIVALATSPDGSTVATASANGVLRIWPLSPPATRSVALASAPLFHVRFAPDGELIASESQDGSVNVCRTSTLECRSKILHESLAFGLAWSPDGERLGSSGWDGLVRSWSRSSDRLSNIRVSSRDANIYFAGFSAEHRSALVSVPDVGWVLLGTAPSGAPPASTRIAPSIDHPVALSRDGRAIATISEDGVLSLFRIIASDLHKTGSAQLGAVELKEAMLELSTTGRYALYRLWKSDVGLLDMTDPRSIQTYRWRLKEDDRAPWAETRQAAGLPHSEIVGLSFDQQEKNAIVSYADGRLLRITVEHKSAFEYRPFYERPRATIIRDRRIAAVTETGMAWVFDLEGAGRHCVIHFDSDRYWDADLSPNGKALAAVSETGILQLLQIDNCKWVTANSSATRMYQLNAEGPVAP